MARSSTRNTTRRDRHRRIIARGRPPCALCGEDIDYDAPFGDPRSFEVDHIIPIARGGSDLLDNKQPSHRSCNLKKAAELPGDGLAGELEFVTDRCWWG